MKEDKAHWPRCLLWHGWLPFFSGVNGASPWAADVPESAVHLIEVALGRCSSGLIAEWSLPDGFVTDEVAARMPNAMVVWSWIRSPACLLLVLVSLLTSQNTAGMASDGVMLIVFSWIVCLNLAQVLCLFLDICRLYKELRGDFGSAVI